MFKVGDSLIVTGKLGNFIHVGSKVTVVEVDDNSSYRSYRVEDEIGLRQWVYNDDLQPFSPPEKITKNGYEYSLAGPVKPEWLVDGTWVVGKIYGDLYQVIEGENNNFSFRDNHGRLEEKKISTIVNYYRPHEPKDWKWGDWAMYDGKRVFVVCPEHHMNHAMVSGEDFPNGLKYVPLGCLTQTF